MYCCIPPATTLSVAWEGGASEDVMEGVRKRSVDFWEVRRGRKAWTVVNGARRWVFRVSDQVEGERDEMGLVVWLEEGTKMKAVSWRVWAGVFGIACCGVVRKLLSFWMVSSVDWGCEIR